MTDLSLKRAMDLKFVVCALYHFARVDEPARFKEPLLECMLNHRVRGTLLLAGEGINGTIAGSRHGIDRVLAWLRSTAEFKNLSCKESEARALPFKRSRVKLKKEIVTMGVSDIDPTKHAGTYVEPQDWNALISDPDVLVIDTRNDYEVEVGTFEGAISPDTQSFRQFPEYVKNNLDPKVHRKVAMFCTGGIRCEKSTSYLRQQGFDEVYHLKGGILNYLETVSLHETKWRGECFVFDERVTVDHNLKQGLFEQCFACRLPVSKEETQGARYQKGVSCHRCYDQVAPERKNRFLERQKQIALAESHGEAHLGSDAAELLEQKRAGRNRGI